MLAAAGDRRRSKCRRVQQDHDLRMPCHVPAAAAAAAAAACARRACPCRATWPTRASMAWCRALCVHSARASLQTAAAPSMRCGVAAAGPAASVFVCRGGMTAAAAAPAGGPVCKQTRCSQPHTQDAGRCRCGPLCLPQCCCRCRLRNRRRRRHVACQVRLSVVEIYCERIRDLLDPGRDHLAIKQDAGGAIFVEGGRAGGGRQQPCMARHTNHSHACRRAGGAGGQRGAAGGGDERRAGGAHGGGCGCVTASRRLRARCLWLTAVLCVRDACGVTSLARQRKSADTRSCRRCRCRRAACAAPPPPCCPRTQRRA